MKTSTPRILRGKDAGSETPSLKDWERQRHVLNQFTQTLRNTSRIEQLEAKMADLEQYLEIVTHLQSMPWMTPRPSARVQTLSWSKFPGAVDILFEIDENISLWEKAQLAIQPIDRAIEQIEPAYNQKLSRVTELFADLEQDFDDIPRRIIRCELLEKELGGFEESLEDEGTECLAWCVSLVRDVLDYNYAEDLTETHLGLLKKAMGLISEKALYCNKEDYQNLHKEFLQSGLALIPTTQKAIDKYGD